ncbi:TolC family protein [Shewanella waksmanii]|uniref:TolC family protein n=1 Tax=Shewanella waksmanii TaxID=213783 RepID=UPI003734C74D
MKQTLIASLILGTLLPASVPAVLAAPHMQPTTLSASSHDDAGFANWLPQLLQRFEQLPEVKAQQAQIQQAKLAVSAADQAVYNPELGLSYQNASDDTYSLDISQTLDWGDKRGIATRYAELAAQIQLADIRLARSQKLAEVLSALVEQSLQTKQLAFAQGQVDAAKQQVAIAQQQMQVGDLSMAELQMLQLDLASKAADFAIAEQAAISADAQVMMIFGRQDVPFSDFIQQLSVSDSLEQVGPEIPALTSAYQQVMLSRLAVEQAKAEGAADPTISLSAEREGDENKLGVGVSIPLQLRNSPERQVAVVSQGIAIAEQRYLVSERVITQGYQLFSMSLPRLQARYDDWCKLVLTSMAGADQAMDQQWQSGDISTSDYLTGQRQLASGYLAGISLESALYNSWLDWMGQSGQLETFLVSQLTTQSASSNSHFQAVQQAE